MYRHGDVLIAPTNAIPKQARRLPHLILARGEATGHAHRVEPTEQSELFEEDGTLYLRVSGVTARVVHEEHDTIALPAGEYRVWQQREYAPDDIRTIID